MANSSRFGVASRNMDKSFPTVNCKTFSSRLPLFLKLRSIYYHVLGTRYYPCSHMLHQHCLFYELSSDPHRGVFLPQFQLFHFMFNDICNPYWYFLKKLLFWFFYSFYFHFRLNARKCLTKLSFLSVWNVDLFTILFCIRKIYSRIITFNSDEHIITETNRRLIKVTTQIYSLNWSCSIKNIHIHWKIWIQLQFYQPCSRISITS